MTDTDGSKPPLRGTAHVTVGSTYIIDGKAWIVSEIVGEAKPVVVFRRSRSEHSLQFTTRLLSIVENWKKVRR